jgi:lipoate-protein ligase B
VDRTCRILDLGRVDYYEAYLLQRQLVCRRIGETIPDTLILAAHPPVFTIGRKGSRQEILARPEQLWREGIEVVEADRGGAVTYHGPGQLVAYPILNLNEHGRDIHKLLHMYEDVVISVLAHFGIKGRTMDEYPGVWTENNAKICALGIGITRWVSYHGFALNINTNLDHYRYIIPCGISHLGVTSIQQELGQPVDENQVRRLVALEFCRVFDLAMLTGHGQEYGHPEPVSTVWPREKEVQL